MTLLLIGILLLLAHYTYGTSPQTGEFSVTGHGFHREMTVTTKFPDELRGSKVLLKWEIPSGAFVDPYQLDAQSDNSTSFFIGRIDVEQTEHQSRPIVFYQTSRLKCQTECSMSESIPVHFRYHSARHPSVSPELAAEITLIPPTLFISQNSKTVCIDENNPSCDWKLAPIHFYTQNVVVRVPVGDSSLTALVAMLTLATTLLGAVRLATELA